jgi:4-amino-4-deoxy-L-arabinose transferase-like glycosyltransferase
MTRGGTPARRRSRVPGLIAVLAACALVYWPALGHASLAGTEGHRAIPAWGMLESGDWAVPRLFEQPYLRKPPGIAWAIAGSSALFGQTEFAARAVSALASTLMALVAFCFASRWFGARLGVAAGLAQALSPLFWASGRLAEVEPLHNLCTQVAALSLLAVLGPHPTTSRFGRPACALAVSLGVMGMALTKGPAGAPVIAGVLAGACIARRSLRPLANPAAIVGLGAGMGGVLVAYWAHRTSAGDLGNLAITQGPWEFLWRRDRLGQVATLVPVALASGLPATLALLFPFGKVAAREGDCTPEDARAAWAARTLGWSILCALGAYAAIGVDNPRYVMPALTLAPVLVAYAFRGWAGTFSPKRRTLVRVAGLGWRWSWPALLGVGATVYIPLLIVAREAIGGRGAGAALAGALVRLPEGTSVLADHLVEARPDVLWYAREAGRRLGREPRIVWRPGLSSGAFPHPPGAVILRDDPLSDEYARLEGLAPGTLWREVHRGQVYKYSYRLLIPESLPDETPAD